MGRQAYSLVALTPGVIFTQEQFGTTGFAGLHGWDADGKFIINGGIVGTNQFLLNGAPVSLTGSWQFSPNLDGVEEFRVLTNTYDAQYGRTGGGTVMTTLKSGTNAWHGNVFEYFHIDPWNLRQPLLNDLSTLDKPNVLALTGLSDLPIGWGKRWFSDVGRFGGAMLNGWAVDWTLTYASGYPVPRPDANFTCSSFATPGGATPYEYFNTTKGCWKAYGPYDPRLLPDILPGIRNPAAPQLNVSVEKIFWLSDRYTLQFRGEAYNVTNTPILPAPDTTFGDPTFGQLPIQQNNFPRFIQLAAKIVF
jgi:hypothetical protein